MTRRRTGTLVMALVLVVAGIATIGFGWGGRTGSAAFSGGSSILAGGWLLAVWIRGRHE
jgi:hypothetical protein